MFKELEQNQDLRPPEKMRRTNGYTTSRRAVIKHLRGKKTERKRSEWRSFNFSSRDEQPLQLENCVMKPEPGSSCHTQANDKLKRTEVFSRANGEESFPSTVPGPKKTSVKIHRRNSASACVRAAVGARVGARRGGEDPPLHPAKTVGEHRGTKTVNPFLPRFQNAPKLPRRITQEGLA